MRRSKMKWFILWLIYMMIVDDCETLTHTNYQRSCTILYNRIVPQSLSNLQKIDLRCVCLVRDVTSMNWSHISHHHWIRLSCCLLAFVLDIFVNPFVSFPFLFPSYIDLGNNFERYFHHEILQASNLLPYRRRSLLIKQQFIKRNRDAWIGVNGSSFWYLPNRQFKKSGSLKT